MHLRQAHLEDMVPPSSTPPFPHLYSMGAKTPSPPQPPPSATPSTAVLLHHAGADTPMSSSITRDRPISSTTSDWGILASRPLASSPCRPPCRRRSYDRLVHRAPPPPSTLLDLLPRRRQPSLPQHHQILSRCIHDAAPEAVLFRIYSTYLS